MHVGDCDANKLLIIWKIFIHLFISIRGESKTTLKCENNDDNQGRKTDQRSFSYNITGRKKKKKRKNKTFIEQVNFLINYRPFFLMNF